jgi:hypothetical protein
MFFEYKGVFLVSRFIVLAFVFVLASCSSKLMEPRDIKDYEGRYIDTFTFEDLASDVRSEVKEKVKTLSNFSGKITYTVKHYKKDVLDWEGKEIKEFIPDSNGLHRIETKQYINDFLSLTTFEMSYLGIAQLDVQSYKPGHRYFRSNHHIAELKFIETNPVIGLHYKMEIGRRTQIADYWVREVQCKPKGEQYLASNLHAKLQGSAIDFKCTIRSEDQELLGDELVSYIVDSKFFITKENRNTSGSYLYEIESID